MAELRGPLSDVRVIELGHIVAGPFCSLLLANLGAEVVKVERPGTGEILRNGGDSSSSTFNYMNRCKKSITLDLKSDDGREIFFDLVEDSDVVVENFSPGTVEGLGLDYDTLSGVNPGLIYCSVKGFNEGPYKDEPALDPVAEALSGLMSRTGYPDHPPARCGASIADMTASFYGALAVVGALRQRDHTGEGQHITSPLFESTATLMGPALTHADAYGEILGPMAGGNHAGSTWSPYGVFQTNDGKWLFLGPSSQRHWLVLCDVLDRPDLAEDERFETLPDRREHRDVLNETIAEIVREYDREEFLSLFEGENVPVAPVNNTKEAVEDRHLNESGALVEIETAEGRKGTVRAPGSPIRSTGFDQPASQNPPTLGGDTEGILSTLGYSAERIEELKDAGIV